MTCLGDGNRGDTARDYDSGSLAAAAWPSPVLMRVGTWAWETPEVRFLGGEVLCPANSESPSQKKKKDFVPASSGVCMPFNAPHSRRRQPGVGGRPIGA
jgi:hypothetical protein